MEYNEDRFYWWAIPTKKYGLTNNSQIANIRYPISQLQQILPNNLIANDFSIVSYSDLTTLISSSSITPSDFIALPLSLLPGAINNSGISHQKLKRKFGDLIVTRDLTDPSVGANFDLQTTYKIPKCTDDQLCFPNSHTKLSRQQPIERQLTDFSKFPKIDSTVNLFIARVPSELNNSHSDIINWLKNAKSIWTAGIKSLKKLTELGIKVNGTVDALGQEELNHSLTTKIFGNDWLKLTYSSNLTKLQEDSFGWYNLNYLTFDPSFAMNTHFYWMSSTNFLFALDQFPDLKNKYHSSGLGSTFEFLSSNLVSDHYQPFYSIEDWRNSILQ